MTASLWSCWFLQYLTMGLDIYRALGRSRKSLGVMDTHANAASQPDESRASRLGVPRVFLRVTSIATPVIQVLTSRGVGA